MSSLRLNMMAANAASQKRSDPAEAMDSMSLSSPSSESEHDPELVYHFQPKQPRGYDDHSYPSFNTSRGGSPTKDSVNSPSEKTSVATVLQLAAQITTTNEKICLVCGDSASGFHYGIASCEACKAFFKRTVQGRIEYFCPSLGNCEINKRRRKACQACRFKKCLVVGMMREGVRPDRVRGGRQKYKRAPVISPLDPLVSQISTPSQLQGLRANLIQKLLAIEPTAFYLGLGNLNGSTEENAIAVVGALADQSLLETISWAKQFPGFSDLSLGDQMSLLQNSWMELLVVSLAFRSIKCEDRLIYSEDHSVDLNRICIDNSNPPQTLNDELNQGACFLSKKFRDIGISKEEFVLIKAIILSNGDAIHLEDPVSVQKLQDIMQDSLYDYLTVNHPSDSRRLTRILMCLPLLRQISARCITYLDSLRLAGRIPFDRLFLEMLETKI